MIKNIFITFFGIYYISASVLPSDYNRQQHIIKEYNKRAIRKLF